LSITTGVCRPGIVVQTWISTLQKVKSLRKYRIVRPADSELLVRAETNWAFCEIMKTSRHDAYRKKSIPVSPPFLNRKNPADYQAWQIPDSDFQRRFSPQT